MMAFRDQSLRSIDVYGKCLRGVHSQFILDGDIGRLVTIYAPRESDMRSSPY
jgi:hypothetical protein